MVRDSRVSSGTDDDDDFMLIWRRSRGHIKAEKRERERGRAIIISFLSLFSLSLSLSFNLPPKSVYTVNTHTLATCLINHPNLNGAFCSLFFSLPFTLQFHICVCVFCFNISNNTLFKGKICVHCYFCCCCCRLQCKGTTTTNTTEKPI